MAENNEIFERVEKKYLLNQMQYTALQSKMKPYMKVDNYGLSTICNVYYDTDKFDLIRTSIEKPAYKEKLRLRSYGVPDEESPAFIEIKKKYGGIVYKRRISLPYKEAVNYLNHGIRPESAVNPQILAELDYFQSFYHTKPKMYIAYDRIAMFGIQDASIRMTFDTNIRSREEDMDLSYGDAGKLLLRQGEVLMEIKVGGAYPMWMVELLSSLQIYPVSFSKYGRIYQNKLVQEKENKKICLPA